MPDWYATDRQPSRAASDRHAATNGQRVFQKRRAANRAEAAFTRAAFRHCAILAHHFAVMAEINRYIETRQRDAADDFINMIKLGFSVRMNLRRAGVL